MVCMHSETHLPPEPLKNLISVWVFWACFLWSLPTEQGHSCLPDKPQWTRGPFRNLTPKTKNKTKKKKQVTSGRDYRRRQTLTHKCSATWNQIININLQPMAVEIISFSPSCAIRLVVHLMLSFTVAVGSLQPQDLISPLQGCWRKFMCGSGW